MLEIIEGIISEIHPTYIVMEVNGIGYRIVTANPYRYQSQLGLKYRIYCELVVREDSLTLYGFANLEEKQLFLTLNKVSGIGPKSALSIMAAEDNQGLIQAIEQSDSVYLTKFPGVGKKTAQQMILDLKGELVSIVKDSPVDTKQENQHEEIIEALTGLGYSQREIQRISKDLKIQSFESTQEGLSYAFKLLLKK